jgi:hypothetical protein
MDWQQQFVIFLIQERWLELKSYSGWDAFVKTK